MDLYLAAMFVEQCQQWRCLGVETRSLARRYRLCLWIAERCAGLCVRRLRELVVEVRCSCPTGCPDIADDLTAGATWYAVA